MNYWFLYTLEDGKLYGSAYFGEVEEWSNIPEGCGVIGPISGESTASEDAAQNPECYRVVSGALMALPNISDIKAQKEAARQAQANTPSLEERIKLIEQMQLQSMGL